MFRTLATLVLLLALAAHLAAAYRHNVSWDEFALLGLADATAATGELHSGARPGLAVWLLVPLVRDCDDEIAVVRTTRVLWTGITALFLVGLGLWIGALEPDRARSRGLKIEELPDYYRSRNLLRARVTARHVGNAVVFFASNKTPTTGATLPVDGGLVDAFPR